MNKTAYDSIALGKSKNPLINKDDIGKARPTTAKLPPKDHAYGQNKKGDKEGAQQITYKWSVFEPSQTATPKKDFRKMNKVCVKQKITDPKEWTKFTKSHEIIIPPRDLLYSRQEPSSNIDKNQVYGIKNKPSTPVKDLIGNGFGNAGSEMIQKMYENRILEAKEQQKPKEPKINKAQELLVLATQAKKQNMNQQQKPLYKLKQFSNVKPKVQRDQRITFDVKNPKFGNLAKDEDEPPSRSESPGDSAKELSVSQQSQQSIRKSFKDNYSGSRYSIH